VTWEGEDIGDGEDTVELASGCTRSIAVATMPQPLERSPLMQVDIQLRIERFRVTQRLVTVVPVEIAYPKAVGQEWE
jgi:hypothetical protein